MSASVIVESFECTETAAEPIEASEEALSLIESLGLTGQQSLAAKREGKPDARCPYREITKEESQVYSILCPTKVGISAYSASPIPLRVLQIASHAMSLGTFDHLEVWDRASVEVKNPVLVANTTKNNWDTGHKCFILARWGEELETFVVLKKRAVEISLARIREKVKKFVAELEHKSADEILEARELYF